jgi:hypothetical protein
MVGHRRASTRSALAAARRSWRARPTFVRRVGVAAVAAVAAVAVVAWPAAAAAEPSEDTPFGPGVTTLELDLSSWGLFDPNLTSLAFSLGSKRYLLGGFAVGLSLADTIVFYRDAFEARHPGIAAQLPTNILEITPLVQYVFFRSRWFSPYVYGGVGPVFFNHGGGTHGQWSGGPGVYVHVRGPIFASLGVGFSGLFPSGRCNDALVYQPSGSEAPGVPVDLCSFRWGPQLGVTLAFGGRGRERRSSRRDATRDGSPPGAPAREAAPSVAPRPVAAEGEANESPVAEPPPTKAVAPAEGSGASAIPPGGDDQSTGPSSVREDTAPRTTDVPVPPVSRIITPAAPRVGVLGPWRPPCSACGDELCRHTVSCVSTRHSNN